ncbi:MAG: aldose epimerase family protein, partial [Bacteroidota bacterium]
MLSGQQSTTGNYAAVAEEIKLFTIENSAGTKLIVSNYGAAVQSFFVKDRNGKPEDIVLGYDDINEYVEDEYYIGTVIGRYANRIAGENVSINGSSYKLATKEGGYHHHGGKLGFNKKIFEATPFKEEAVSGIIFKYTSPHLEEGFPGELEFEVKYTLDNDDIWTIEYKAVSNKTTLVNFTQHSYFNLSGDLSSSIKDHEVKILSHYYLPVNNLQVPDGEVAEVNNTPFDFTQFKKIGKDISVDDEQLKLSNGYDHSFVLEKQHSNNLKHAAVVKEKLSGRKMDVYTTEPSIHFYSGNFLY